MTYLDLTLLDVKASKMRYACLVVDGFARDRTWDALPRLMKFAAIFGYMTVQGRDALLGTFQQQKWFTLA